MHADPQALNMHDDLIARCKAGDREAHYQLYKLYSRAMYNVCYRVTGNAGDAEDALQEAFISAFRNMERYRPDTGTLPSPSDYRPAGQRAPRNAHTSRGSLQDLLRTILPPPPLTDCGCCRH